MEGYSNFKITISFHSSIFGMEGQKMEWKEIATPLTMEVYRANLYFCIKKYGPITSQVNHSENPVEKALRKFTGPIGI